MNALASTRAQPVAPVPGRAHALRARSPTQLALRRFRTHRLAMFGLALLVLIAALAVLAPLIAPADPLKVDLAFFRKPPSPTHPLGTDSAGRDVLSRLLYGGQVSLTVGLIAAGMSTGIGLVLGSIAGSYGGWVDAVIMRLTDVVLSFPALVVIITVVALVGPSMLTIILGIGLFYWPTACRIVRGLALSLREQDFVMAARALSGAGRATATGKLGQHAQRGPVAHNTGVHAVAVAPAGHGDRRNRTCDQLHW